MAATLMPWPRAKFFTPGTNVPLAGGKVWTYLAGTTTPQLTKVSASGANNTNPVVLDANGEADIWLVDGIGYKINVLDASNNQIPGYPIDEVYSSEHSGAAASIRADIINSADVAKGDALIAVKNPGTNSVARTQHQKNADTASIYDYFEPGGDIGEAINNAVADAGNGGFELLIPASADGLPWEIEQVAIIDKPGFTLRGCGTQGGELSPSITPLGVVIKQANSTNLSSMLLVTGSGFRGQNITLDGNALNQASGAGIGLYIRQATGVLPQHSFTCLDRFNVTRTRGQGILALPAAGGVLDRMNWRDVYVRDTYGSNVELQDVGDSEFWGVNCGGAFDVGSNNIKITTCRRLKFHGGLADFAGNGIAINVYQGSELQFFGMQAEAAGSHGWYFDSSTEVDLVACQARNNGTLDASVYAGFYLAGTADKVRMSGCRAWDAGSPKTQDYGLIIATAGDASFTDCDFEDNLTGPISSSAANFANKTFTNVRPYHSPAVNAYRSGANQSIPNNTFTKVQIDAEDVDTAGWFDTTLNRFIPLLPGNYTISWTVNFASAAAGICFSTIYKNGTRNKDGAQLTLNASYGTSSSGTATLQANGTTDYFELYAYQNSGGAIDAQVSAPIYPYLSIARVSG